jgi:ribosome maturation factor RimP
MLSPQAAEKLKNLADEVSRREGCRLYDFEFSSNPKSRVLRVFIEGENSPVSVDQCANVSRGLSLLLDVEDIIPGGMYELEVSSPGIERPLRLPWHFQKALGQEVKVVTFDAIAGLKGEVKSIGGVLSAADEATITVKVADSDVRVDYPNIKRAQVVFGYKKNDKKR